MTLPELDWLRIGERAYDAYGAVAGWKNDLGFPMPAWDELTEIRRAGWVAAAQASYSSVVNDTPTSPELPVAREVE